MSPAGDQGNPVKPKTRRSYETSLRCHVLPLLGEANAPRCTDGGQPNADGRPPGSRRPPWASELAALHRARRPAPPVTPADTPLTPGQLSLTPRVPLANLPPPCRRFRSQP